MRISDWSSDVCSSDLPALTGLADAAAQWGGRASTDSASYRIVRAWRLAVVMRIKDGLTAPAQAALGDGFEMPKLSQFEGVAWPLLQQRPAHLPSRRFATWAATMGAARSAVRRVGKECGRTSRSRLWPCQ